METNSSKVRICPDKEGNVVRVSKNNADYAHVRITQSKITFGTNGWVNRKTLSALFHGKTEDLVEMKLQADQEMPGNIVIKESFHGRENDLKIAGDTGIVCQGVDPVTGEVSNIYRTTYYDTSGMADDILIPHINGEEIKSANSGSKTELSQSELNDLITKKEDDSKEEEVIEEPKEEEVVMEDETFEL